MRLAAHIGRRLSMDANGVESDKGKMNQEREERREGVGDIHNHLDESDEEG